MKANRKFLNNDDEAVSPVIAVILMVAITVVLAATVYVWVSGFGSNSSQPAKSLAVTSAGVLSSNPAGLYKNYTVASASPGLKYSDFKVTLNGADLTALDANCAPASTGWDACGGTTHRDLAGTDAAVVSAGDTIFLYSSSSMSGASLRFIDSASNSVMLTLTIS